MAALRISRPGHPTERKSGHGGVSLGYFSGTVVVSEHRREQLREAAKRYRERAK